MIDSVFTDFGSSVSLSSTLAETINSATSIIELADASDFPIKGSITIEDETILYTGKSSNSLTGCIRGHNSTTASSHSSGTVVITNNRPAQSSFSTDKGKAGWYLDRLHNDKTLRVSDSDILLPGIVRFNRNNNIFQGFNGTTWIDFNATKGDTGDNGADGISTFNIVNLPETETNDGELYVNTVGTDVNFRSLVTSTFDVNPAITGLNSIDIDKSDSYLTLTSTPRPYHWDFSSNNSISYLKSSLSATTMKAFGTISTWKVKSTILAGMAVRISLSVSGTSYNESTTGIVIEPYTYSATQEEITEGSGILGIALQSKSAGESCQVCSEGITTVMMGTGNGAGNQTSTTIDGPGAHGFVGYDAKIYNESLSTGISTNTPSIGYWLERGTFSAGEAVLFYVQTKFSMT